MLANKTYDKYRKPLKELIFSSSRVKPRKIGKELFGVTDETCIMPQTYLIGTNGAKKTEMIWGKFFAIPIRKKDQYVVIFQYLLKQDQKFTGCVESEDDESIVIKSLLDKDHQIIITPSESPGFPGLIMTSPEIIRSARISEGHWMVLQKYFKGLM